MKTLLLLIVLILTSVFFGIYGVKIQPFSSEEKLTNYAQKVKFKCTESSYKPLCYENEILKIATHLKMEDSFTLTTKVQEDPAFAYCHVLAHKISFLEAKRKPDAWKEIINRCPISMCNYGCLHGSLIQHYRGEVLSDSQIEEAKTELKDVCEPRPGFNPTEIDRTMCYHALGHLAMYMTDGEPKKSTGICKEISIKPDGRDYYETCIEGVFMTIFQGVDPEDLALVADIKPIKDNTRNFCAKFDGLEYEACNRESYPSFRDELKDPSFISQFCSYTKNDHGSWKCYATVLGDVTVEILEGRKNMTFSNICSQVPRQKYADCFANIATRIIQVESKNIKKAVTVCEEAESLGVGDTCFEDLIDYGSFTTKKGSTEFENYCFSLPGKWKNLCLNQT